MSTSNDSIRYQAEPHVDLEIAEFINEFFKVSDTPGQHDNYVKQFLDDATFVLASKRAVGSKEIRETREGMWTKVSARRHKVYKVFTSPSNDQEVMFYGVVKLTFKNDTQADVDWSARAELAKEADGKYRMKFYQVYLDTGGITAYPK